MAAPGGGIELPIYTKVNDVEIELGTMTIPISTHLEPADDGTVVMVVTVGPEDLGEVPRAEANDG